MAKKKEEYVFDIKRLKAFMEDYGDSISSLARYLGSSRQNLSQVFNGKHCLTYEQIVMIANKYDLDAETFFEMFIIPYMKRIHGENKTVQN